MGDDRKPNGQFAKGKSGNPAGPKPKRREKSSIPASQRRMIFEVSDRIVPVKHSDGTVEKMPLYKANVLAIATRGARGDRASARGYLELVARAAETDITRRLAVQRHFEIHDDMEMEIERLRKKYEPGRGGGVLVRERDAPEHRKGRHDDQANVDKAFREDDSGRQE